MALGTKIISSLFIWLILIGITALVFFVVFTVLVQIRKRTLKQLEESIKEDKLKTDPDSLGTMNDIISETWNKRADNAPIPEKKIIAQGWSKDPEGNYFSIREEIKSSFKEIERLAYQKNHLFARKPSMCAKEYLFWLSKQKDISIEEDTIIAYLSYYNTARYESPDVNFNNEDFAFFKQHRDALFYALSKYIMPRKQSIIPETPTRTVI